MEDQSLFNNNQPEAISEGLQNFIDAMVEEIVLDSKPFDTQKKYLKKFSENEGLNYEAIEKAIAELTETMKEMKTSDSKTLLKLALFQAKECHVTEAEVRKIIDSIENEKNKLADIALFPAKQNGLYGYIDVNGNMVIKPQFESAEEFFEGLAAVELNDKYGFVDKRGNMVIEPRFDEVFGFDLSHEGFSNGLAVVRDGQDNYMIIDHSGENIAKELCFDSTFDGFSEGLCAVEVDGKKGYVDTSGVMVIEPQFEIAKEFSEGLASVQIDSKWGFIDKIGAMRILPRFGFAESFSEGLSAARKLVEKKGLFGRSKGFDVYGKYGFVNKNGDLVVEHRFDYARSFHEGLASVEIGEHWGFIDQSGIFAIAAKYGYVGNFAEGLVAFAKEKDYGKQGYMDKSGYVVIEPQFSVAYEFKNGLAQVEMGSKSAYIDHSGRIVFLES